MAVGDIFQVRLGATNSGGVKAENVFYYIADTGPFSNSADLQQNFFSDFIEEYVAVMGNGWVFDFNRVINGMNNTDFYEQTFNEGGAMTTGTLMPSFTAVGFRSSWAGGGTRRSYKRMPAPRGNDLIGADNRWSAGYTSALQAILPLFSQVLEGDSGLYIPIQITGGFQIGVAPTVSFNLTEPWQVSRIPTSQVSRKEYLWIGGA